MELTYTAPNFKTSLASTCTLWAAWSPDYSAETLWHHNVFRLSPCFYSYCLIQAAPRDMWISVPMQLSAFACFFFLLCVCVCVSIHVCTLSHHSMCFLWMWPRAIRRMRVYIFRWNSDCMQQHVELSHFAFLFSPHPPVPLREIFIRFGEVTHIYYSFCSPGVKLPMQLQCCETWRELCFGLQHAALACLQYATLCNTSYCYGGMGGICINWIGI